MNWVSFIFFAVCLWLAIHHGQAYKSIPSNWSAFMCAMSVLFAGVNLYTALT